MAPSFPYDPLHSYLLYGSLVFPFTQSQRFTPSTPPISILIRETYFLNLSIGHPSKVAFSVAAVELMMC